MLGITVPGDEASVGSIKFARQHAAAVGLSVDDVCRLILTPDVCAAMLLGASSIRTRDFEAVIRPDQRKIVTINFPNSTIIRPPMREIQYREGRREAHQRHRRNRKKNAVVRAAA